MGKNRCDADYEVTDNGCTVKVEIRADEPLNFANLTQAFRAILEDVSRQLKDDSADA